MTTAPKTPKEILITARALIAQGWCKGRFKSDNNYCALGAIREATLTPTEQQTMSVSEHPQGSLAKQALKNAIGGLPITCWNDDADSKEVVLAGFDEAIKLVEPS